MFKEEAIDLGSSSHLPSVGDKAGTGETTGTLEPRGREKDVSFGGTLLWPWTIIEIF